jgi:hypothetical protein
LHTLRVMPFERRLRPLLVPAAFVLLLLNLCVLGRRMLSLLPAYNLAGAEGGEAPSPYGIWRVIHHLPAYTWPTRPPFVPTLYNFSFYYSYAGVLRALHVDGPEILLWSRLLTAALAAVGAVSYYKLIVELSETPMSSAAKSFAACMAGTVWLGSNFIGWWPLAIRPDVASWLLVTIGLWLYVRGTRTDRSSSVLLSSLAFVCAWSFKQSTIWTFVGVVLHVSFISRRRYRALTMLLPFTVIAGLAIAVGGEAYRFDVLRAPALSRWHAGQMLSILARVSIQNSLMWLGPCLVIWKWISSRRKLASAASCLTSDDWLLLCCFGVSLIMGLISLGRDGSNKNHIMEAYLAAGILTARLPITTPSKELATETIVALLLLLPMIGFPAAQLVWPNALGVTELFPTPLDKSKRLTLGQFVSAAPKPVFIDDVVFSLPWYSAAPGATSAFVSNRTWYALAEQAGAIEQGGTERLIREGQFATVIVAPWDPQLRTLPRSFSCKQIADTQFVGCAAPHSTR